MAAAAQPPPGLFTFFKHGALLPARNRGLFLSLALSVVTSRLVLLFMDYLLEAAAALVGDNANVHAELAVVDGAIKIITVSVSAAVAVVNGAIQIIIVSAAVASYTGERHTLVSILGKVKSNLWGPLVTVAFGFVLQFAAKLPLIILVYSFSFIQEPALYLYALLELASLPVKAICDVAVVASVAEPGQRGPRAAARAWRLMEGKKAQAALYVAAVWTLSLLYNLPAVVVVSLCCADEVLFMAVVTAYYFECRRSQRLNENDPDSPLHRDRFNLV